MIYFGEIIFIIIQINHLNNQLFIIIDDNICGNKFIVNDLVYTCNNSPVYKKITCIVCAAIFSMCGTCKNQNFYDYEYCNNCDKYIGICKECAGGTLRNNRNRIRNRQFYKQCFSCDTNICMNHDDICDKCTEENKLGLFTNIVLDEIDEKSNEENNEIEEDKIIKPKYNSRKRLKV